MRAPGSEIGPAETAIHFAFDGARLEGRAGETVAAALTAHGIRDFRATRDGHPRGLFCGMGVCQECLVAIDGVPNLRACMIRLTDSMTIHRQVTPSRVPAAPAAPASVPDFPLDPDVLVIGGGAAGLSAAAVAAESGARVVLVDERPAPGGQFFKQPAVPAAARGVFEDRQHADGRVLIARARAAGVAFVDGVAVDASLPLRAGVLWRNRVLEFRPRRLIVAAGAYERGLPVAGWTLPGVMTTGAAQTLLRSYRVLAGRRVVVAGNGPLNLQVALELKRAGADVAAVAELAPTPSVASLRPLFTMALAAPRLLWQGLRYLLALRSLGVPVHFGTALGEVRPGLAAKLVPAGGRGGIETEVAADAVCIGYGFLPSNELLRLLGCEHRYDARRRHLMTVRDAAMRTGAAGVFAAGDCCGLGGAHAAIAEGTLAGAAAAAEATGKEVTSAIARQIEDARRGLARHREFQGALWQLFAAGPPDVPCPPATAICRCEDVTAAEFEAEMMAGSDCIGTLKRHTRLGMGRCQGRYCVPEAVDRLCRRTGATPDDAAFAAPRAPLKPVPIAGWMQLTCDPSGPDTGGGRAMGSEG